MGKSVSKNQVFDVLVEVSNKKEKAIKHLEKVRINPDFMKAPLIRSDIEFFLPQICSYYLDPTLTEDQIIRI